MTRSQGDQRIVSAVLLGSTDITEEGCLSHLESLRWPNGVYCLRCGRKRISRIEVVGKSGKTRQIFRCADCEYQFSSLVGSIFEGSHLPLAAWFTAIGILGRNHSASAKLLQRELNISYESAWKLKRKVSQAWRNDFEFCTNVVALFESLRKRQLALNLPCSTSIGVGDNMEYELRTWEVLALARRRQVREWSRRSANQSEHPHAEDFDRLALGRVTNAEKRAIENHLNVCDSCARRWVDARLFAKQLERWERFGLPEISVERRQSARSKVNEPATLTVPQKPELGTLLGTVIDVSDSGIRVRMARGMDPDTVVEIEAEKVSITGSVRHVHPNADGTFDMGVAITEATLHFGDANPILAYQPMEVLLVEDNPPDAHLTELMLNKIAIPHRLSLVVDGAEALQRLGNPDLPRPSLLILDLNLPKVSGIELLEIVRKQETLHSLPVVVLSVSVAERDIRRTNELGISAYFQKPYSLDGYDVIGTRLTELMTEIVPA